MFICNGHVFTHGLFHHVTLSNIISYGDQASSAFERLGNPEGQSIKVGSQTGNADSQEQIFQLELGYRPPRLGSGKALNCFQGEHRPSTQRQ